MSRKMKEARRLVNGIHVVALGESHNEAEAAADRAAAAVRENRPMLGLKARERGAGKRVGMLPIVRIEAPRPWAEEHLVWLEGDREPRRWSTLEYA